MDALHACHPPYHCLAGAPETLSGAPQTQAGPHESRTIACWPNLSSSFTQSITTTQSRSTSQSRATTKQRTTGSPDGIGGLNFLGLGPQYIACPP